MADINLNRPLTINPENVSSVKNSPVTPAAKQEHVRFGVLYRFLYFSFGTDGELVETVSGTLDHVCLEELFKNLRVCTLGIVAYE